MRNDDLISKAEAVRHCSECTVTDKELEDLFTDGCDCDCHQPDTESDPPLTAALTRILEVAKAGATQTKDQDAAERFAWIMGRVRGQLLRAPAIQPSLTPEGVRAAAQEIVDIAKRDNMQVPHRDTIMEIITSHCVSSTAEAWLPYDQDTAPREVELLLRWADGHHQVSIHHNKAFFWFEDAPTHYRVLQQVEVK